ncbi:hypothetical protein [Chloroflexus sp.]|uniref:hypothetical protein n=1 Tax=Chloroflexus sp. TaxID=1904827 RepID=UPI00298EF634|nr:hypothetical protein [Chloroflexus sp.]MCS6887411.1 hypothetical protein [Chloroflexus sp.]MCX7858858.1 hypothetical protein [Chloroflexus sp.]MDW8402935.1 hypothetical protein [Chloroflexus sp.]
MATRRVESFLVRIVVAENEDTTAQRWSGRIQHIGTGFECRIDQLDELLAFITNHLQHNPTTNTASAGNPTGSATQA